MRASVSPFQLLLRALLSVTVTKQDIPRIYSKHLQSVWRNVCTTYVGARIYTTIRISVCDSVRVLLVVSSSRLVRCVVPVERLRK